jgi:hypothetical protein
MKQMLRKSMVRPKEMPMDSEFGKPLQIRSYWNGISSSLEAKLVSLKAYLKHPSTGYVAETMFRQILRDHLPSRFTVDTGFVVNSSGQRSDFIDIIIADTLHIAPLCNEPAYRVFPVESVCAVIEVTTSPKQQVTVGGKKIDKFASDILKLARVRELGRSRNYLVRRWDKDGGLVQERRVRTLRPRAFLITSGEEWKARSTYQIRLLRSLNQAKSKSSETWVNAAFSVGHGLIKFKPFTEFAHREWIQENALFEFVFFLNHAVQTFCVPEASLDWSSYRRMPDEESDAAIADSAVVESSASVPK